MLEAATCPACAHDSHGEPDLLARFGAWLTRRPKPEGSCRYIQTSEESGVGLPGDCGCSDRFHRP